MDSIDGLYVIYVYSDTSCGNYLTTIVPSKKVVNDTECGGCSDSGSECIFMGEGVHWGSVMLGGIYLGPGVDRTDGLL